MFGGAKRGYGNHIVIDMAGAPKRRIEWRLPLRHVRRYFQRRVLIAFVVCYHLRVTV